MDSHPASSVPLVVDLDGTLIVTDSLIESALVLIKQQPLCILLLPLWLLRGKAALKSEIALRVQLPADSLPYRAEILEYLRSERAAGRMLVLATAAHESIAHSVASHLRLFDLVLATDEGGNLKGAAKRDLLVKRFGVRGFDYIGDHRADLPVWQAARLAHVAGGNRRLAGLAHQAGAGQGIEFTCVRPRLRTWLRALRVQQWVKNVLVFVPLFLAHRLNPLSLAELAAAFFAFSFLASGTYIVNDLFDLAADRKHPVKCRRPFACGELAIAPGIAAAVLLVALALGLGALLGLRAFAYLSLYLALTLSYSLRLKHLPILDVVLLAFLYTLRLIVGGNAGHAPVSPWLFQFSIFLFLSLAFAKRYSELYRLRLEQNEGASTRGYQAADLSTIHQAGTASGLLATLVIALYVNGSDVARLYVRPHVLWAVCPILVYWILRVWLIAGRGNLNEDPILFAFRDRASYLAGLAILTLSVLAMVPRGH